MEARRREELFDLSEQARGRLALQGRPVRTGAQCSRLLHNIVDQDGTARSRASVLDRNDELHRVISGQRAIDEHEVRVMLGKRDFGLDRIVSLQDHHIGH